MYTVNDIVNMGAKESVRQKAKFDEVDLYCSDDGKLFESKFIDLYQMFTIETQHTYGSEYDLLFILGALKVLKDNQIKVTLPTSEVYDRGMKNTIEYITKIGKIKNVNLNCSNFHELHNELEDSGKFNISNYFCWYRNGRYDYLNLLRLLEENNLIKLDRMNI